MLDGLLGPTSGDAAMRRLFADDALIQTVLAYEKAHTESCAEQGLIEQAQCTLIAETIDQFEVDVSALRTSAHHAGTLAIPLVRAIRERVAESSASAAELVHLGSTSQDVLDTVLVVHSRRAVGLLNESADLVCERLAGMAEQHAATSAIGRTLLRRANPLTLGLRFSTWLSALSKAMTIVRNNSDAMPIQFGGAVGTLAGLSGKGAAVAAGAARRLGVPAAPLPWHTDRSRVALLGSGLALVGAALGKCARDFVQLGQEEIAELSAAPAAGRGGSSAMPHKRNPTDEQQILLAADRLPHLLQQLYSSQAGELERGVNSWQMELPTLAEMFIWCHDALRHAAVLLDNLAVDVQRIQRNLIDAGVGHDVGEAQALTLQTIKQYRGNQ